MIVLFRNKATYSTALWLFLKISPPIRSQLRECTRNIRKAKELGVFSERIYCTWIGDFNTEHAIVQMNIKKTPH